MRTSSNEFVRYYTSIFSKESKPTLLTVEELEKNLKSKEIMHPRPRFVTLDVINKMLEYNVSNRKIRKQDVDTYTLAFKNEEYDFKTPNSMYFDGDGLRDGQHRLKAAQNYLNEEGNKNKLVLFHIGFGYNLESSSVTDIGKNRDLSDIMRISYGLPISNLVSQSIIAHFNVVNTKAKKIQPLMAKRYYLKNKKVIQKIDDLVKKNQKVANSLGFSGYVFSAFVDFLSDFNQDYIYKKVFTFLEQCLTTHISKFEITSPQERWLRFLQDIQIIHKSFGVTKHGSTRHDIYKRTRLVLQSYIDGAKIQKPFRLVEEGDTSDVIRRKYGVVYERLYRDYNYKFFHNEKGKKVAKP